MNQKQFAFEKFTQTGGVFSPMISVRKDGALGISQGALRKFGLAEGEKYVVLHYDRTANAIGIEVVKDESEEGAIKLVKREAAGRGGQPSISASISARSFLEYYGINRSETTSYRAYKDENLGFIIVELNSPEKSGGEE